MKYKGPLVLVESAPCIRIPTLVNVDEFMGQNLCLEYILKSIGNGYAITGPCMRHFGFATLGDCHNRGSVGTFFCILNGAVLAPSGVAIGDGPRGDPGKIERIIVDIGILLAAFPLKIQIRGVGKTVDRGLGGLLTGGRRMIGGRILEFYHACCIETLSSHFLPLSNKAGIAGIVEAIADTFWISCSHFKVLGSESFYLRSPGQVKVSNGHAHHCEYQHGLNHSSIR